MKNINDAAKIDDKLLFLANYEVRRGNLPTSIVPQSYEDIEKTMDLQSKIHEKFNYFKSLIRLGEFSLEELEDDVISRNGPFANAGDHEITGEITDEILDKIVNSGKNNYSGPNILDSCNLNIEKILNEILSDNMFLNSLIPKVSTNNIEKKDFKQYQDRDEKINEAISGILNSNKKEEKKEYLKKNTLIERIKDVFRKKK